MSIRFKDYLFEQKAKQLDDFTSTEEELEEASKGRSRDTKVTPSLSRGLDKRNKKAMNSKERQQGKKAALDQ